MFGYANFCSLFHPDLFPQSLDWFRPLFRYWNCNNIGTLLLEFFFFKRSLPFQYQSFWSMKFLSQKYFGWIFFALKTVKRLKIACYFFDIWISMINTTKLIFSSFLTCYGFRLGPGNCVDHGQGCQGDFWFRQILSFHITRSTVTTKSIYLIHM